jgi:hypothetical protein
MGSKPEAALVLRAGRRAARQRRRCAYRGVTGRASTALEEVGLHDRVASEGHAVGVVVAVEHRHRQAGPEHEAALGGREHAQQR